MANDTLSFDGGQVENVAIDIREAIRGLKEDKEFFIQFYMPELEFAIPEFHLSVFGKMISEIIKKFACALPRGHNKTTLAKLAVVYYFLFTRYRFIIYVSNTAEIAQAACRDIVGFLQSENHVSIFGYIQKEIWREGEGIFVFYINIPFVGRKKCILRALGANQQVRGINIDNERPELGVVDDLEDDDNTATEGLILKLKNWVYGPFFKAFNRWKMKIIWIGNLLSDQSLLNAFCDPENEEWESIRLGCLLSNGEPLWPDLWPISAIRSDYIEYRKQGLTGRWFAEMMNLPIPAKGGLINADEIRYYPRPNPGDSHIGFITIDPAISDKEWANDTAIVVHLWIDGRWMVVDFQTSKFDPLETIDIALELMNNWGLKVIGVESVAYQAALKYFIEYILLSRYITNVTVFPTHKTRASKTSKLAAWASLIKNGTYYLPEDDFEITEQLLRYDPTKKNNKDDLIDACSQGVEMIEQHLGDIMQSYQLPHIRNMQIETSSQMCPI